VCNASENRKTDTKTPYFTGSKSLKVIDVNTAKKLVTTCYGQLHIHVYAYLQMFSR